ncbi:hypothetical protein P168DRAFT_13091 [Aspergillus campestris IBT 28561]|uniref:Uncharacterized protein n=1 Tax=Aspergillus campestris (strain IBT 28561) TaxID=1392248 RepID=A0A2I1DEI2_ASPC2|nr:uncharacterized protein P168DRAFT_13091 [Aspergillus campestris IBT 28561]PKY08297.1 hypothetical protein P168DRAFT_13091 [Aspergillus campestris IBT 28561]
MVGATYKLTRSSHPAGAPEWKLGNPKRWVCYLWMRVPLTGVVSQSWPRTGWVLALKMVLILYGLAPSHPSSIWPYFGMAFALASF